ncbi:hypothetical protein DMP17_37060 [Pseudonocardia sp. TMWB2A]|uniref:hypothetical protein n=1 Tax=Pseudonocardia sp. TMWB2A TaxID=687430 RepID=UPI00307D8B1E
MRELDERIRDHGAVGCLTGAPAPGTPTSRARRAARERVRAADGVAGAAGAGSSAAARAAHRWAAHGAHERALTESVARHPAARSRRAPVPGPSGAGPAGGPNVAVRTPRCTTAAPAPGATATLTRPAPAAAPARTRSVAVPAPRTVRPPSRRCLVPARPRPARSRARGRLERFLTGVAALLCATTAVVALGLLGDAAAGWNAPAAAVPSVGAVR